MFTNFLSSLSQALSKTVFLPLFTAGMATICSLTVYGRIQDAIGDQHVAGYLLVELSRSRKRNITILCALLGYYAQLDYLTAAEWMVFLILISNSITAFYESVYPGDIKTIRPFLFTLLHSIPGLSVRTVLVAEIVRAFKNRVATTVCQLILALGLELLLCFLKRMKLVEQVQVRDEERRDEEQ